jgi:hypothetical protein
MPIRKSVQKPKGFAQLPEENLLRKSYSNSIMFVYQKKCWQLLLLNQAE